MFALVASSPSVASAISEDAVTHFFPTRFYRLTTMLPMVAGPVPKLKTVI